MDAIEQPAWPARPWLMAGVGATTTLITYLLLDSQAPGAMTAPRDQALGAAASAVMVAGTSFVLTAEQRRLGWAVAFALGWGAIMGLVAWTTALASKAGSIASLPFFSGLVAVAVAAPLFQVLRDEGRRAIPYDKAHFYAWSDAITGATSLAFTGLTFLLTFLMATLFDSIGVPLLKNLLDTGWFGAGLAGAAFGAAAATLRERASLLAGLQRLAMLVIAVLAPLFAGFVVLFLAVLPLTGFAGLWKSGLPETPLLLSAAGFAFLFLNAIIADRTEDRRTGPLWRWTEYALLLVIAPLATLSLVSMGMRVGQYGWTPERLWGVVAGAVALAFGVANLVALIRGRAGFDMLLRRFQVMLAAGLVALALLLALPIVDFGAISTRSQVARLETNRVSARDFDWGALAFDFGPAGRRALERLSRTGAGDVRALAAQALKAKERYAFDRDQRQVANRALIDKRVRLLSSDIVLTDDLRQTIANRAGCGEGMQCALVRLDARWLALLVQAEGRPGVTMQRIDLDNLDGPGIALARPTEVPPVAEARPLGEARVEVRTITRRQLFVDGKPAGENFE